MKTITLRVALLALMVFAVACGKGGASGKDETTAAQDRDAKVLEQRFQQVRGTYEGTIANPVTGLQPLRSKLTLFVVNVRESANPDGTVRIRPSLYGRFQLVDAVSTTDYVTLIGNYDELGQLTLTSLSAQSSSTPGEGPTASEGLSLKGTIYNGVARIEVVRNGGGWGIFDGTRTTFDSSAPTAGDFDQYRERLMRVLTPVEGVYTGILEGGADRVKVAITITIGEDAQSRLPVLMGQYRRLDFDTGVGERQLSIDYDSTTGTITMSGLSGGSTVPGSNYFSGTGIWSKGMLKVTLRDRRGLVGRLSAPRAPLF